jgi:hypothetical protein
MSHTGMACIVHGMRRAGVACALAGVLSLAAAPALAGYSSSDPVDHSSDPRLEGLTVKPRRICDRRSRNCHKTKAAITYTLSEDARVTGGIDPVGEPAGRLNRDVEVAGKQGTNSIRVRGPRFQPGVYKVTLSAEDEEGNESDAATAFFRVRHARR